MWTLILLFIVSLFGGPTGCACDLKIKTSILPDGTVGVPYSANINSTCGAAIFFNTGDFPPGLSLNTDGHIRGTPTATGVFQFTVGAIDSNDLTTRGLSITIDDAS